ncbi:hypothetical protein PTTG_29004 [Puccinia triticina 1-1 BBBD Race 1]|uniref:Aconitase_C domain-containing protein n=2 Tax=Puccinia triticina TaxID=208348 RepID=A0A180G892_PUCT1|nr:uncharacterized protein PtA15_10A192 [Puccinia triticina]OAV88532.1 hypothetical protein PTTG_29004 [Puccinia triticina 1-1 BBBD Race 1]WAQ88773.1 hypothetical protein PtA15_10A192 [Puccinia triticina]WAR58835.1 hypothetical protein PtB15_10B174 [Puccinia triticina]
MKGKLVADGVMSYVAAVSSVVQAEAKLAGIWAKDPTRQMWPLNRARHGPAQDEVGISATKQNYKGRMGHPLAHTYLTSCAVVATSAVAGKPKSCGPNSSSATSLPSDPNCRSPQANKNFVYFESRRPDDKYTYHDDISPEGKAAVVMENYDRLFAETVRHLYPSPSTGTLPVPTDKSHTTRAQQSRMTKTGVILVVGHKFGTGLSRKQAATALRNTGISLVISATFGKIWKRK